MGMTKNNNRPRMSEPIDGGESWPDLQRVRRTIVVADMVESVRLMQRHEADVIQRWRKFVSEARADVLPTFGARLVKSLGDGMLLECDQPARAVALGFELHRRLAARDEGHAEDDRIQLRIGMHVADVVHDELDVYGAGVNLAARIGGVARIGGSAASVDVVDELLPGVDAQLEDAGPCYLKNLELPVHIYHVHPPVASGFSAPPSTLEAIHAPDESPLSTCVAVMPIEAGQGGVDSATLAALIGDLLVTRLSTRSSMRVISRLSTEQFRIRGFGPGDVARHTGAEFLLAGRLHGDARHARLYQRTVVGRRRCNAGHRPGRGGPHRFCRTASDTGVAAAQPAEPGPPVRGDTPDAPSGPCRLRAFARDP
jgi:adenylate cyclase